jgi:hypothetical protein
MSACPAVRCGRTICSRRSPRPFATCGSSSTECRTGSTSAPGAFIAPLQTGRVSRNRFVPTGPGRSAVGRRFPHSRGVDQGRRGGTDRPGRHLPRRRWHPPPRRTAGTAVRPHRARGRRIAPAGHGRRARRALPGAGPGAAIRRTTRISFCHCKNVDRNEVKSSEKLSRSFQRRRGRPLTRYWVLDIEPMKRVLDYDGQAHQHGLRHALHICRGSPHLPRPGHGRLART